MLRRFPASVDDQRQIGRLLQQVRKMSSSLTTGVWPAHRIPPRRLQERQDTADITTGGGIADSKQTA